jgi:SDR family mycofactocin-dependent oxidoreductase
MSVALVTGAARGIGAATVRRLAADGWSVLAVDVAADVPDLPYRMGTEAELDAVVAEASRLAASSSPAGVPAAPANAADLSRVRGFAADVRDPAAMAAAVTAAEEAFGGLDAALAVAGVIAGGVPLWEMPAEQLRAVIDVDLLGPVNLARAAVPALLRRPPPRHGRFIAVASAAATRGLPMLAAYCAAKAGVTGLIRALAVELGDTGITANAVSPGSTATPILDESARLYALPSARQFAAQQPMRRLLDPAEVAAMLVYLAGPDSSGMTGAIIPVDGGLAL